MQEHPGFDCPHFVILQANFLLQMVKYLPLPDSVCCSTIRNELMEGQCPASQEVLHYLNTFPFKQSCQNLMAFTDD